LIMTKLKPNPSHASTRTQGSSSKSETVEVALDGRGEEKRDANVFLDAIDGFDIACRDASARFTALGSCGHCSAVSTSLSCARPAQTIQADEIFE
jgi:hypothetical protein